MQRTKKAHLRLLGSGAVLLGALTACLPPPVPYVPPTTLSFQFPDTPRSDKLTLGAFTFTKDASGQFKPVALSRVLLDPGYAGTGNVSSASINLYDYELKSRMTGGQCTRPFEGSVTQGMQAVTVSPNSVQTCDVYFSVFNDINADGVPSLAEELYLTHDILSYATSDFTYSLTSADGNSTETGSRQQGWSLVRHLVWQPSATPGKYRVTMNSVPVEDQAITLRMHAPTDRLTSQGLAQHGGLK